MNNLAEVLQTVRLSVNGKYLHVEPVGDGKLDPALLDRLRAEKPRIMPLLRVAETACEGLNLAPTELLAGLTVEDMEELSSESVPMLRAYALAVTDTRTRERGEIPSHYTSRTICKGCGSVPIFAGCPEHVDGCPWCWNRLKGLPAPRAST